MTVMRLPGWLGVLSGLALGFGLGAVFLFQLGDLQGLIAYALVLPVALWIGLNAGWVLDLPRDQPVPESRSQRVVKVAAQPVQKKQPARPAPLLDMVEIPGGGFLMGAARDDQETYPDEFPQHPVQVSAFWMSRFPVTVEQYRCVMEDLPSRSAQKPPEDRFPANVIDWFQAIRFCNALSEREGLEPCYEIEADSVQWLRESNGYRLPTEAEWEYAARARTQSRYFFGDDATKLGEYAWYSGNSDGKVHPVGLLKPNPFGLYDMLGNVWEWCWDWHDFYEEKMQSDPCGPNTGSYRDRRGGSAWDEARDLRSSYRVRLRAEGRDEGIGFRCVRSPAASH